MIDEKKLLEIAKEIIGEEELTLDTIKEDVEEWDSLAQVMIVAAIAENFGVRIALEQTDNIHCLRDFMQYEK